MSSSPLSEIPAHELASADDSLCAAMARSKNKTLPTVKAQKKWIRASKEPGERESFERMALAMD
jgi:hypothetical protein